MEWWQQIEHGRLADFKSAFDLKRKEILDQFRADSDERAKEHASYFNNDDNYLRELSYFVGFAKTRKKHLLQHLHAHGVNFDICCPDGCSLLHLASKKNLSDVVRLLLDPEVNQYMRP